MLLWLAGDALVPEGIVASFALVQAWIPRGEIVTAVNGPAWSLSCEAFFYLLFPVLHSIAVRIPPQRRLVVVASLVLAVGIIAAGSAIFLDGYVQGWLVNVFPPVRMLEFVLGILLALHLRDGRMRSLPIVPVLLLVAGAWFAAILVPQIFRYTFVMLVPFMLLIASVASAEISGSRSLPLLRSPLLITLGTWSYAFYLVHERVIVTARRLGLWGGIGTALLWGPILLVIETALSFVLFATVERPLEQRLKPPSGGGRGSPSSAIFQPDSRMSWSDSRGSQPMTVFASVTSAQAPPGRPPLERRRPRAQHRRPRQATGGHHRPGRGRAGRADRRRPAEEARAAQTYLFRCLGAEDLGRITD